MYLLFGPEVAIFLTDITSEEKGGGITAEVNVSPDNGVVFVLAEIFEECDSHLRALSIMIGYGFDQR